MANDNNIKTFTAADIEKYHKGQLSAKEMHDLEKASLDDPFLADALEGYAVALTDVNADIAELKKRLAHKTEQAQAKIIPMNAGGGSSFPWLRAAVVIILIAGAGLLSYQFLFNAGSSDNKIAQAPKETEKTKAPDSIKTLPQSNSDDKSTKSTIINNVTESNVATEPGIKDQKFIATDANGKSNVARDSITVNFDITATNASSTSVPVKAVEEKADYKKPDDIKQGEDVVAGKAVAIQKNENKTKDLALKKPVLKDGDGVTDQQDKENEVVVTGYGTRKRNDSLYRNTNFFRARVTDANNNALPFANITNTRDNVGTFSDAQGLFTLVSPDTVMNVQVKALGFQSGNVQLRGYTYMTDNRITLQEDRSLSAKILDTVKRNISRARSNTMTFEEPEPADGWGPYGSYLVNNLNIPESFDIKKAGETADNVVEVSFEVNKNGEPVNMKVEKSLCDKCDKEAMRLIKEGPKWKRKAKKGRTTVAVPFIKPE